MTNNIIIRWLIGLLILGLCLIPAVALAVNVPVKSGYIQDTAQVLSDSEFDSIYQAIEKASFSLYVLTIESSEGEPISSLATSVFSEWSLGHQDALLLISLEEQEVYLELFTGSALDKSITQAEEFRGSANAYTQLIDDYFVPHAADGDFFLGITSIIQHMDIIKEQAGTPITSPSTTTDQPKVGSTSSTVVFLIILLIIVGAVIAFQWYRRFSVTQGKKKLMKELEAALGTINQIEQDIEPMVQLSKGESQVYLRSLEERFYQLLQASTEFNNELKAFVVPIWVTNSTTKSLRKLQQNTEDYTTTSTEILNSLNEYQEMESQMSMVLEQSLSGWNQADRRLTEQIEELGYPLEELLNRSASLKGDLARSSDSIEFDPLHVKALLEQVPEQIAKLLSDIELVSDQKSELQRLPEQLLSTQKKLDQLIRDEKLLLVEIKPYAFFDQVDDQIKTLTACLEAGNTNGADIILQRIHGWIEDAVEQVTSSVRARDWNKAAIESVSERLSQYQDVNIQKLEQRLQEIKLAYQPEHWGDIPDQIKQIKSKRSIIDQLLHETINYNLISIQRYLEAERNLKQMIEQLVEMDTIAEQITRMKSVLDHAFKQHIEDIRLVETRHSACKSSMIQSGIQSDGRLQGLVNAADQASLTMNRLAENNPRSLTKLAAGILTETAVVQQLEDAVYAAIEAKRAAEIALEQERARKRRMNNTFGGGSSGGGGFGGGGSSSSGGGSGWKSGGSRGGGSSFSSKSKGGGSKW